MITKKFMDTRTRHSDMTISYIDAMYTEQIRELLANVQACAKDRLRERISVIS